MVIVRSRQNPERHETREIALYESRSGGWAITEAENVGADIRDLVQREDEVRHLRVRRRKEHS